MREFNCTTPFGDKKTSICEDPKTAIKALNLYLGYQFTNNGKYLKCLQLCKTQDNTAERIGHKQLSDF